LFGNSIRIFAPLFTALGRNNEEMVRQYRRAYSRKALKALEPAALELGVHTRRPPARCALRGGRPRR
jgi:hypothetical protein